MKKLTIALIVSMLLIPVVVLPVAFAVPADNGRYYVFSDNAALKSVLGVHHEFKSVFSTKLNPTQLGLLHVLGIKTEPVGLFFLVDDYGVKGKPVCGDGILHPSEQCGEQGLECPSGYVCENCKCVEEATSPARTCYPNQPYPWGILKVNGGSGGAGITVSVLDTGVYVDHLDLDVKLCKDATRGGKNLRGGCDDFHGHGTHTSGTVAANGGSDGLGIFGVAPEVNLWHVKVCVPHPIFGAICYGDDMAKAIRYVADKGTNIISMSIGGDSPDSQVIAAIDYAVSKDVLVVAAAGNDREDGIGSIDYPGAFVKVIAVAAFDSSDNMASFSSLGENDGDWIIEEKEIEFAAPGVDVESTYLNGCYEYGDGTSMSTPHVAGLAALHWRGSSSATRTYLQQQAEYYTEYIYDYGQQGDDIEAGFGLPIPP